MLNLVLLGAPERTTRFLKIWSKLSVSEDSSSPVIANILCGLTIGLGYCPEKEFLMKLHELHLSKALLKEVSLRMSKYLAPDFNCPPDLPFASETIRLLNNLSLRRPAPTPADPFAACPEFLVQVLFYNLRDGHQHIAQDIVKRLHNVVFPEFGEPNFNVLNSCIIPVTVSWETLSKFLENQLVIDIDVILVTIDWASYQMEIMENFQLSINTLRNSESSPKLRWMALSALCATGTHFGKLDPKTRSDILSAILLGTYQVFREQDLSRENPKDFWSWKIGKILDASGCLLEEPPIHCPVIDKDCIDPIIQVLNPYQNTYLDGSYGRATMTIMNLYSVLLINRESQETISALGIQWNASRTPVTRAWLFMSVWLQCVLNMHPSSSSMCQNVFSSFYWNKRTGRVLAGCMWTMMDDNQLMVEEVEEVYTHVHTLCLALAESVNRQSQAKDNDKKGMESLGELELNDLRKLLSHLQRLERSLEWKRKEAKKVQEIV
ncbi:hypothetical protein M422DRAFT_247759 [Sphaerobolus stellatus SS14]|nr:hypothetical protein M422DRAFT_247759 [Sphaerobolus stellatus SS14]